MQDHSWFPRIYGLAMTDWQIFFEKEKNSSMSKKNIFLSFLVLEYIAKKGKNEKAQTLYIICEKLHKYVNKKNLCSRVPTEQQKKPLLQPLA